MAWYRLYTVGRGGHFTDAKDVECSGDELAIERARQLANGHCIELWEQSRFIGLIAQNQPGDGGPAPRP